MHFAEVEGIARKGNDFILDIDVRPNRAGDCFSHLGIAREIAAILNLKLNEVEVTLKEEKKLKAKDFVSVEVRDKKACLRYSARVITNVSVGSSPKWLKDRLETCGLRPINNIVDITNYVMLETGQPLHAFDSKKISGNKIIVRFAKDREKIVTLDEQKFDLDSSVLVIADEKKAIAIAGIKGGKMPEIDRKTKTVILESANFNQRIIRSGSRKLNLKTDASIRFEHGVDPNLTEFAINRAAYLIQKIAGGGVAQGLVDVYTQKVLPKRIKLDLNYVGKLLGLKIPEKEIKDILKRLGFSLINAKTQSVLVEVPTRRLDVSLPEDLIEEVGRVFGYQNIKAVFPSVSLIPPEKNEEIFWEDMAKDILKEAGFSEVYNYSFFGEKEAKIFNYKEGELIEVENPLSLEQKYLRASLIPNLLKNIQKNQSDFGEIRIFELGKIFKKTIKNQKLEKKMATGLISGNSFYQLKGIVDLLLNKLGIAGVWYDEYQPTPEESKISVWQIKKCAEIKVGKEEIGFLGLISPRIIDNMEIKKEVCLFDIDFEKLAGLSSEEVEYRPISRFPAVVRDLAVLVPFKVKVEDVLNKIETAGGLLIRDIDLFDIYEGEELPGGKKNLAFHIVYQSKDKTLSSKEVDAFQNKIIKVLEEDPEWQVRRQ